jgi:hypothetical protein
LGVAMKSASMRKAVIVQLKGGRCVDESQTFT